MTLEELKKRILETEYLPKWLKDSVGLMGRAPVVVLPATAPPQPETKRWCPMVRVNVANTPTPSSFNRAIRVVGNKETGALDTEMFTLGSYCIEGSCQMWSGNDCGLKTLNPDAQAKMREYVQDMKAVSMSSGQIGRTLCGKYCRSFISNLGIHGNIMNYFYPMTFL